MRDNRDATTTIVAGLAAEGVTRNLAVGEELCRQHETGTDAYVIISGGIEATILGTAGDVVVAQHGPGALVGEVTSAIGGRRTATLRASTEAVVRVVSRDELTAVMADEPEAASEMLEQARRRTESSRVAALMANEFYATDEAAVAAITQRVTWRTLEAGEQLFAEGDEADAAYLIVAGRLQVFNEADGLLADLGRGDIVGEIGLVERGPRTATVDARRETTLARLTAEDFADLSLHHAGLAMGLVRRVLHRNLQRQNARERAARSVALVQIDHDATMVDSFTAALDDLGTTLRLSPDRVDEMMAQSGVAQAERGAFGEIRLSELFHYAESNFDQVLLTTVADGSTWSQRILRRADIVVIACPPRPNAAAADRITSIVAAVGGHVPTWLMVNHPAGTSAPRGTTSLLRRFNVAEVHHVLDNRSADLARVARLAAGRGVGLVLGGGGARGYAHLGVMRALEEHGIPVDRITGASMGAVIGAGIAQGTPQHRRVSMMAGYTDGLLDYTVPVVSIIKAERITESLESQFGNWDLADLWTPFTCVSTNLTTSKVVVHRTGPAARALRASVSLPGIMPPVADGGDLLVDGGILNNLPVDVLADDPSIGTIIACDVTPAFGPGASVDMDMHMSGWSALRAKVARRDSPYPGLGGVLVRSMLLGSTSERDRQVESGAIDLYLDLDLADVGLLEFEDVAAVAELGYRAAEPRIAAWTPPADQP